jgi:hypothetical protein
MRVAEDDPRAHGNELVDEEQAALEHLLEDQDRPLRLRGDGDGDRGQVGWERRPRAVLDLRDLAAEVVLDLELLARGDGHRRVVQLDADAEALEVREDRPDVLGGYVLDGHVPAGDRGEADEAGDLDVLGADAPLAAVEGLDAVDAEDVRADAVDPRAERLEEAAEILDVRLARGVADHGLPLG